MTVDCMNMNLYFKHVNQGGTVSSIHSRDPLFKGCGKHAKLPNDFFITGTGSELLKCTGCED